MRRARGHQFPGGDRLPTSTARLVGGLMGIEYTCGCGNRLSFDPSRAGERCRCPACHTVFKIPSPVETRGEGDFVSCPTCGKQGRVPPSFRGKVITCKKCGTTFNIPGDVQSAVRPVSAPTSAGPPPASPGPPPPSADPKESPPVLGPDQGIDLGIAIADRLINYDCPHCGVLLTMSSRYAGKPALCGACNRQTVVPDRQPGVTNSAPLSFDGQPQRGGLIVTPILVSAIANIVIGLFWCSLCLGAVVGLPMLVLSVYEFMFYSSADTKTPLELHKASQPLAIAEIVLGVFNTVSLICGIIVLINRKKLLRAIR